MMGLLKTNSRARACSPTSSRERAGLRHCLRPQPWSKFPADLLCRCHGYIRAGPVRLSGIPQGSHTMAEATHSDGRAEPASRPKWARAGNPWRAEACAVQLHGYRSRPLEHLKRHVRLTQINVVLPGALYLTHRHRKPQPSIDVRRSLLCRGQLSSWSMQQVMTVRAVGNNLGDSQNR